LKETWRSWRTCGLNRGSAGRWRIAAANPLQELLGELSRRYALRQALQDANGSAFAGAQLSVETQANSPSQAPLGADEGLALTSPKAQPIRRS
jgi:hypothetical protein